MKKTLLIVLAAMTLLILHAVCLTASADDGGYRLDLPDEISVGLYESIRVPYSIPEGGTIMGVSCSEPGVLSSVGTGYVGTGPFLGFSMTALGQYTLHFYSGSEFARDVIVHVEEAATAVRLDRETFVVEVGKTESFRYTLEGGILFNPFLNYDHDALSFDLEADPPTVTCTRVGNYTVHLNNGLGTFQILVVDTCEGVRLSSRYDRTSVGYALQLLTYDAQDRRVLTRLEITEGAEYSQLIQNNEGSLLRCTQPGYVTVVAYGTDGSEDSIRLKIYEPPTDIKVTLSSRSVPAGEYITVKTVYKPSGTWYPLGMDLLEDEQLPDDEGLEGPVAVIRDNRILGILPGKCELNIYAAGISKIYSLTVTDSGKALVFERPRPYFDLEEGFQISVHDRSGTPIPARYSVEGLNLSITEDGFLSASDKNAIGAVIAEIDDDLVYSFLVRAKEPIRWLSPAANIIEIPVDVSCEMCSIKANVAITPSADLILCSGDESVVRVDGWTLVPQSVGTATVTVWSRYNDVHCTVLVYVTEPTGRLYVDGMPDYATLYVPVNSTVPLPTVTDYLGNRVTVTWNIAYETPGSGNPYAHCISLIGQTSVKGLWHTGAAELTATSAAGKTLKLNVFPYGRAEACGFAESEYTVETGSWVQVDFMPVYASGSANNTLRPQDVTFTLTGDTDCVLAESFFHYYLFEGVSEGTVTLKATLYNGQSASAQIHVVTHAACVSGHDPVWSVEREATADRNGIKALRCSRCGAFLGEETVIPCTGRLRFAKTDYYVSTEGDRRAVVLGTSLDGDRKQSFTWQSSDPQVAAVLADTAVGVSEGTAVITVTKGDCVPATCRVHVLAPRVMSLPGDLLVIEDSAFEGIAVTSVVIPDGVTEIGSRAFADCPALMEVTIPTSVTFIAQDAFEGSDMVVIVCGEGSYAAEWAAAHFFTISD